MKLWGLAIALALAAFPAAAHPVDGIEHLFGVTSLYGFVGNGAVTAGFTARGEMMMLRHALPKDAAFGPWGPVAKT